MLIAGGTGGGKTYFILTLIEALLRTNAVLFVLDPKNADLADLQAVMPDVYYKNEDMLACIDRFYEEMMKRSEDMKLMENYRTGENYAYLGLPANFLIFDEYVAFMEMLGTKENAAVLNKLKQIVMLGRQAGFFLILACQRPDAKYLGDGIRDQFNFRVALGRMSEMGYIFRYYCCNQVFPLSLSSLLSRYIQNPYQGCPESSIHPPAARIFACSTGYCRDRIFRRHDCSCGRRYRQFSRRSEHSVWRLFYFTHDI